MKLLGRRKNEACSGMALLVVSVLLSGLAALSLSMVSLSSSAANQQKSSRARAAARYVAEAGIADALLAMSVGEEGDLGGEENPVAFGDSGYWVERSDLGGGLTSLVSTGVDGRTGARVELVVRSVTTPFFSYGAFGDEFLSLDSNAKVDSYDSSEGSYDSQAVNGSGSKKYANANGSTGSNGDITLDSNTKIWGNATPGPDGSVTTKGKASVSGSTLPMSETVDFPGIEVPEIASSGPMVVGGGPYVLPAGEHHFDELDAGSGAEIHIHGPATVVFDEFELDSNSELVIHAENGPVEFYVLHDFVMNSNTTIASTTFMPSDLSLYLLSDNVINPDEDVEFDEDAVDFDSNAQLYGTVYAPEASVEINSNFELFGAMIAKRVHLDSNAFIHFDEALLTTDSQGSASWETVCWRELSYSPH